jgi:hypothetical protein
MADLKVALGKMWQEETECNFNIMSQYLYGGKFSQ